MSKTEIVNPHVGNFIGSFRDIGYSFEVAVADLLDNSITAKATSIKILTSSEPNLVFTLLDNGLGMSETELVEAMRLASKNPLDERPKDDLGRFGLGLKTASFSQCKRLTVVSKKQGKIHARQWDIDFIVLENKWSLITPDNVSRLPFFTELTTLESGTLVNWDLIDRCDRKNFSSVIDRMRKHLSLVFHRYLEGFDGKRPIKIHVNNNGIKPFNPFNLDHPATQELAQEKIQLYNSTIKVQPYILPHHSKLSQQEYDLYATEEGYIGSQGFYLYRGNRILIYGTWWGLHKTIDAHKLVRIKIDIPNNIDTHWGIDIKKSIARPSEKIRQDLMRIIDQVTEKGSRPFTGRAKKISDKNVIQFWEIIPMNDDFRFALNISHPLYRKLISDLSEEKRNAISYYLNAIEAYLPIDSIQFQLQKNPQLVKQEFSLSEEQIIEHTKNLLVSGLSLEEINELFKTQIYINRQNLLKHEQ